MGVCLNVSKYLYLNIGIQIGHIVISLYVFAFVQALRV